MDTLGKKISKLRKSYGLSQAQLAEKLGIATSTLGMYETDKREPSNETLASIAKYFHVSVDSLLGINPSSKSQVSSDDLDNMLDNARSFDGKPMSDHDRELIKTYLKGLFDNK